MYHFSADHPPEPIRLSYRALIAGHIRQYLKDFQLDAIRFMHNFLAKGDFCVYNDESGLGKQAAVVVLLDAACSSRKCLIIVQNDDRYVTGWEFHFNVLTNTNVTVIKDENDNTDSAHSVYIAKWSTLRTMDDLSKFKFDFIVVDNRGQMMNNSFCTSMLLKHYERKINILISSVDITSDLKLLHNVLRLVGRLEPQYSSFKIFEEKFKLPDAKELSYKRVDLEEYFCKRERLADYCKIFRLRRYCHQFETQLPLVKEDRYKINLDLWRDKQNATNSDSSSIAYVNYQNREDEHIKDTQELFEEYCRHKRKEHLQFQKIEEQRLQQREQKMLKNSEPENDLIYNVDDEIALINDTPPLITEKLPDARDDSDEPILMSPLMVESDSDVDDIPEICNDAITDIEIVDLSSEEKEEGSRMKNKEKNVSATAKSNQAEENSGSCVSNEKVFKRRSVKKRSELDKLEEDIVDTLKVKKQPKRLSRHAKNEDRSRPTNNRIKNKRPNEKKLTSSKNTNNANIRLKNEYKAPGITTSKISLEKSSEENRKGSPKRSKIVVKECGTVPEYTKNLNDKNTSRNTNSVEIKKNVMQENINKFETSNTTPLTSRKTRSVKNVENIRNETSAKTNENQVSIKQEVIEETPHAKKINPKYSQGKVKSEKIRLKREMQISPMGVHHKQTRSMQRLTRSAGGSKYTTRNLSLQIDKSGKPKKSHYQSAEKKNKELKEDNNKQDATNKNKKTVKVKTKNDVKDTQTSIISHRSSEDYESFQCAQRLSDPAAFDNGMEKTSEFLVPPAPSAILRNSLIPLSLTSSTGFLTESEVIFITPSKPNLTTNRKREQVILLSSSDNENSTSQSSSTNISMTSRRTRALKPKRNQQQTAGETSKVPSFSDLLTQRNTRTSAKSPDLFSNCSDIIQLPCTQPNVDSAEPNTPFEGFKIFGSEVKQLQQHYAFNKTKTNKHNINLKNPCREQRSCLDILEKMFEPSIRKSKQLSTPTKKSSRAAASANKQKSHTQILPSHPIEAINEARQKQETQKRKRSTAASSSALQDDDIFEITHNGTFGSVMRLHSTGDISPVQNTQKTNTKQHNKITNYLIGNIIQNDSQDEITPISGNSAVNVNAEAGTPSKRQPNLSATQNINIKKSPKGKCNTTQVTKLTKWFTKPSELNNHENTAKEKSSYSKRTITKLLPANKEFDQTITTVLAPSPAAGKRILKRRRLDLSFNK